MPNLQIIINNKIATYVKRSGAVVCGNSDYVAEFAFDQEWDAYPIKTARFVFGGSYVDQVFEGRTCQVPVLSGVDVCAVGVFAGDLRTTTPALVPCQKSILCEGGAPADPPEDVYNQIMELLSNGGGGGGAVNIDIEQTTGNSETAVMSQKATTEELDGIKADIGDTSRLQSDISWEVYPVGWKNKDQVVGDTLAVDTRSSSYYHGTIDISRSIGSTVTVSTYAPTSRPVFVVDKNMVILSIHKTAQAANTVSQDVVIELTDTNAKYLVFNCYNYPTNEATVRGVKGTDIVSCILAASSESDSTAEAVKTSTALATTANDAIEAHTKASIIDQSMLTDYYIHESRESNGDVYVWFTDLQLLDLKNATYTVLSFNSVYTALTSYQAVSPEEVIAIRIPARMSLVYDTTAKKCRMTGYADQSYKYIKIATNNSCGCLADGVLCDVLTRKQLVANEKTLEKSVRTNEETYKFAARILADQTPTTATIMAMADTHTSCKLPSGSAVSPTGSPAYVASWLHSVQTMETMGAMAGYANISANIHFGDILTTGYTTKERPQETLSRFCAAWRNIGRNTPSVVLRGNHDDNGYGVYDSAAGNWEANASKDAVINQTEWFLAAMGPARNNPRVVMAEGNSGACYIDDDAAKIRVICLNTTDLPESLDSAGNYKHTSRVLPNCGFSQAQLTFVGNALSFDDKEDGASWGVVIVSHIPLDITNEDGSRFGAGDHLVNIDLMWGMINAYKTGGSYSHTTTVSSTENAFFHNNGIDLGDFTATVNVSYDHPGDVIALICGHMHADNTSNEIGGSASATEYGYRFISLDSGALSAAAITINRNTRTIHVRKSNGTVLLKDADIALYHMTKGLTEADLDENGDWQTTY